MLAHHDDLILNPFCADLSADQSLELKDTQKSKLVDLYHDIKDEHLSINQDSKPFKVPASWKYVGTYDRMKNHCVLEKSNSRSNKVHAC
jgi:hypothetical protein